MEFSGKVVAEQTKDIQAPPQSSAVYLTLNETDLLAKTPARSSFLVVDLLINGKPASRNLLFFDVMRNLTLPTPAIETNISGSTGDYTLTLRSPVLARNVYLSFGDLDLKASDNYFDLIPGEQTTIHLMTKAPIEQVKSLLKIMSLANAFNTPKAAQ
jgi:beta-mannosidase